MPFASVIVSWLPLRLMRSSVLLCTCHVQPLSMTRRCHERTFSEERQVRVPVSLSRVLDRASTAADRFFLP